MSADKLNNYWVDSYKIVNNKILINAKSCGEQCGVDVYELFCENINENKSKIYPEVAYEITYKNGSLSELKLVEKTSFENVELFNRYYGHCK